MLAPFRRSQAWIRAHPRGALYALSLALHLALAPFLIHDWDGFVFIRTVQDFLHGHSPYAIVEQAPSYIFVGDGAPVVNSWYAYPPIPLLLMAPFFGAITFLLGHAPWVERVGIKVPIILGDLALAYVTYRLTKRALDANAEGERRARLVEKALLLNPFLIFVSAAWGMFDAWMLTFVLASVWMALERRAALAGVALALAILIKPFPALLLPLGAVLAFRWAGGWRGLARWSAAGVATGLAVCVPFYLAAPHGFVQQVFLNHLGRPPQGFTLAGVPLAFGWIDHLIGFDILPSDITPEGISRWSFFALIVLLAVLWLQTLKVKTPGEALTLALVTLTGMLLVSKVVNEQYFLMPVALAAAAYAVTDAREHIWIRRAYTFGGLASGILLGYHFLTFIPVDVATHVFPWDPTSTAPRITHTLRWNDDQAFVIPTLTAALCLVPALLLSLRLVGRQAIAPFQGVWPLRRSFWRVSPVAISILVVLVLVAPASAVLLANKPSDSPLEGYQPPEGKLVGGYYYLWWNNPAHDPTVLYGNWAQGVSQVPEDGYFTTSSGKMLNDFKQMRANGIDLVVYSYHGYDRPKLPGLVRVAAEAGVVTAPMLDLVDMMDDPRNRPVNENGSFAPIEWGLSLRNETRDAIAARILDPLGEFSHFPTWWKVGGDPVVFLRPTQTVFYDLDGPSRARIVDAAVAIAAHDAAIGIGPAPAARAVLDAQVPHTPDALAAPGNALWRRAFHEVVTEFWAGVAQKVAQRQRPVYLVGAQTWDPDHGGRTGAALGLARLTALNASFVSTETDLWQQHFGDDYSTQAARWDAALLAGAQAERGARHLVFATVTPGYDDRPLRGKDGFVVPYEDEGTFTYDRLWADAAALRPDVVLVDSWNNFLGGTAIEPTRDLGDTLLRKTAEHAAAWRAGANATHDVLVLTNVLGATYHNTSGDPDGAAKFSTRLQQAAERLFPGRVDAIDWNGPTFAGADLASYRVVLVEPGSKWPATDAAAHVADKLDAYARAGGHVILLGSDVGVHLARLVGWSEPPLASARLALDTDEGALPIPVDAWAARHDIPADAQVVLWLDDGRARTPGVWQVARGNGTIAVTAFRPQGTSDAMPPSVFPAVLRATEATW